MNCTHPQSGDLDAADGFGFELGKGKRHIGGFGRPRGAVGMGSSDVEEEIVALGQSFST